MESAAKVNAQQPTKLQKKNQEVGKHHDGAFKEVRKVVDRVLSYNNDKLAKAKEMELEARQMIRSNHQLSMRVLLHTSPGAPSQVNMRVDANITFQPLRQMIIDRCKMRSKIRLSWIDVDGEIVELTMKSWRKFILEMWCVQPWVVHVHNGDSSSPLLQHHTSRILFARYDVNRNGRLERHEVARMLVDLQLERFQCSPQLIDRYVDNELDQLDTDGSGEVDLVRFTQYVTKMNTWMRTELMRKSNEIEVFAQLAGRGVEARFGPVRVPHEWEMTDLNDGRGPVAVIETGCFGIRLEVPLDAGIWSFDPSDLSVMRIALQTLFRGSVAYLHEGSKAFESEHPTSEEDVAMPLYNMPCSPIVRIDFPAFERGREPPALGDDPAPRFLKPLTLVMPHSFDAREDQESIAMLAGAAHGATRWEPLATAEASSATRGGLKLHGTEMRVSIPYAGTFCAFPRRNAWAVVSTARFYVFTMSELPRGRPTSLRVQLCPEIPPQLREMEFAESSKWGLASCVGASQVLHLVKGLRFRLSYLGQEKELTWVGMRDIVEFTIPAALDGGRAPNADDPDKRDFIDGIISIDLLPGIGTRAGNLRACAKRAGMPEKGMPLRFSSRLKPSGRPSAPSFQLRERSATGFTVVWKPPRPLDSDGNGTSDAITHYEIQLATTATNGTYFAWQELWCGAGHASPDHRIAVAKRTGDNTAAEKLRQALQLELLGLQGAPGDVSEETNDKSPVCSYTLPCDPTLFGQLRIRCWAEGEARPSLFSSPLSLPRHNGNGQVDIKQKMVDTTRAEYFRRLSQHVTSGKPVGYRIGNPASLNRWGGDAPLPPPKPTAKEQAQGNVMAPVPYDVPRLPKDLAGINAAGDVLARFYREQGVRGCGGGQFLGLCIDHVLQAIVGTPTCDGLYSPRRTMAGLSEPLMALAEVVYADVLLSLFDETEVLWSEWQSVDERIFGVVAHVSAHRDQYTVCEPHVKEILSLMVDVYETARQCQSEKALTFHVTHKDYTKQVKQDLTGELSSRLELLSWKLSTELLNMQLSVRNASSIVRRPLGWRPVGLAAILVCGDQPGEVDDDEPSQEAERAEPPARKHARMALLRRAGTVSLAVAGVSTTKSKEEVLCIVRTQHELTHPADCICQRNQKKQQKNSKLLQIANVITPSVSLLKSMHEQATVAQARVQAEMEQKSIALTRARIAATKLLRRAKQRKEREEALREEEAIPVDASDWAEARRRGEINAAVVSSAETLASRVERKEVRTQGAGLRRPLPTRAPERGMQMMTIQGNAVATCQSPICKASSADKGAQAETELWPAPPDRVQRVRDQGYRSGAINALALHASAKAARASATSASGTCGAPQQVFADFPDGYLRAQDDALQNNQHKGNEGDSRVRQRGGAARFLSVGRGAPNLEVGAEAADNWRRTPTTPSSPRAVGRGTFPQTARSWRPAPTLSAAGAQTARSWREPPAMPHTRPVRGRWRAPPRPSSATSLPRHDARDDQGIVEPNPRLRLMVPLRELERALRPLLVVERPPVEPVEDRPPVEPEADSLDRTREVQQHEKAPERTSERAEQQVVVVRIHHPARLPTAHAAAG